MREEEITKRIVNILDKRGWEILAFDYPQSGTGIMLKDSRNSKEKNKNCINPDILAIKNNVLLVMENKFNFSLKDIMKLNLMKDGIFNHDLDRHFPKLKYKRMCVGVGLYNNKKNITKVENCKSDIDFCILIDENSSNILFYIDELFF